MGTMTRGTDLQTGCRTFNNCPGIRLAGSRRVDCGSHCRNRRERRVGRGRRSQRGEHSGPAEGHDRTARALIRQPVATETELNLIKSTLVVVVCVGVLGGCSEGSRPTSSIPKEVAGAWPAKWCEAQPGSTKEELVAIMGQPTSASPKQMSWSAHQFQFNAFLDPNGKVEQLDINFHSLSDAEKAALQCGKVRTQDSKAATAAATRTSRQSLRACALVTQAEMSAILGAPVVAEANDRSNGKTECIYQPASGISPYVEFSVDWGGGEAAMTAMGMMGKIEPGLANPYDGLGDQAAAVGPMLMIRAGEDLVTIVFTGVSDTPAKAKQIFDTAKGRW